MLSNKTTRISMVYGSCFTKTFFQPVGIFVTPIEYIILVTKPYIHT